jgi:peptidoglycan/xylan/chitin deacetylase (PgdA/CDA1 family)
MRPGWYILLYHDVSWEQNPYLRGIGGSCPPDLLREHVAALAQQGQLASPREAYDAWRAGAITRPTFSFWFDDGLLGVCKYALPALRSHGVAGAISVCSRFIRRDEMFWRFKLSFLNSCDGLRHLRWRLKKHGYAAGDSLKRFVLDRFSLSLLEELDAVYLASTSEPQRADAFRLFASRDELLALREAGWIVANHTAAHYPVSEPTAIELFAQQFAECEAWLRQELAPVDPYWVTPFDRRTKRATNLLATFHACRTDARLVLVGNEVNDPQATNHQVIKRIFMPMVRARPALRFLNRLPYGPPAGDVDGG